MSQSTHISTKLSRPSPTQRVSAHIFIVFSTLRFFIFSQRFVCDHEEKIIFLSTKSPNKNLPYQIHDPDNFSIFTDPEWIVREIPFHFVKIFGVSIIIPVKVSPVPVVVLETRVCPSNILFDIVSSQDMILLWKDVKTVSWISEIMRFHVLYGVVFTIQVSMFWAYWLFEIFISYANHVLLFTCLVKFILFPFTRAFEAYCISQLFIVCVRLLRSFQYFIFTSEAEVIAKFGLSISKLILVE